MVIPISTIFFWKIGLAMMIWKMRRWILTLLWRTMLGPLHSSPLQWLGLLLLMASQNLLLPRPLPSQPLLLCLRLWGLSPPSSCCASPTSNVAGAQPTPSPLPPAEKIPSPPPEKSMTPSSLLPGCCESSPSTVAGKPFSAPGSNKWRDLFSNRSTVSYTRLQNFSLNHLSKTCVISSEDIQPAFDVWKYCVVG